MITEKLEKCIWFNKTEKLITDKIPFYNLTKINDNKIFFNDINHSQSNTFINNNFFIIN